ncbi:MAG TPA: hypothetical protein PK280_13320 [Planctomycetota bacterium]|nr:hypothetical protein [Planctomycetota bacterium]
MKTLMTVFSCTLLCAVLSTAGEVSFTAKPAAAKDGDKVKISFTVSAPTDVEVAVLGADGKVVRHLVAGALGAKDAPPEPLKAGLAQALEWDGKDDAGKPAAGGPFKVRVRAGMRAEADGFVLENPASTGSISSLAIGPKGSLYVFTRDPVDAHWGSLKIKVLSREGKHDRALMPFAADLAPERLKPMAVMQTESGDLVPRIHDALRLNFHCGYNAPFWRAPGQSPAVDSKGRVHWLVIGPAIASLDADGGAAYEELTGPKLLPDIKSLTMASQYNLGLSRPALAMSSDEKFIYISGLTAGDPKKKDVKGVPCVFRVPSDTRGPAEVFLGKPDAPGTEKESLTAPRGLAVAGGLVYVADHDAGRIAVFSEKDRSFAGEIKVPAPDTMGVDPASGAVYVCSAANKKVPELVKFEGYKTGKELARLPLVAYKYADENGVAHRIAVDCSEKPARIWVTTVPYSGRTLTCIEDAGDKFTDKGDPRSAEPFAEGPRDLTFDHARGELYVKGSVQRWFRVEEKTGKVAFQFVPAGISNRPEYGTQLVPGEDGNLYTYSWSGQEAGLRLYGRDGKPAKWPGAAGNHIPLPGVMNYMQRSMAVRGDELFIIPPGNWRTDMGGGGVADGTTSLNVYGMDGKAKRTLIWQCLKGAILRMDRQGNIYLAEAVRPVGRHFPEFFDGKVKPPPAQTGDNNDGFYYSYIYGSIVKFPPEGGAIWYTKEPGPYVEGKPPAELAAKPKVKAQYHLGYKTKGEAEVQGALWQRFGFAPYTATQDSCYRTCMCEGGGFDVDPYGRVFFPNLGQFRVEVLDTNGNPVTMFGKYGNQDSGGKDARVKKPDIPLAWPINVVTSETHAYVADTTSRRVAKVKLAWAAEETCEGK